MKILIADDHWVVRESLKQVTKSLNKSFRTVEASGFQSALEILRKEPDIGLMLIDLIMPGFNEFEGLHLLRTEFPEIPVVVVSVHDDPDHVLKAISHGVIGYIPKSASADLIKKSLSKVISGDVSFPREIIEKSNSINALSPTASDPKVPNSALVTLTARERQILQAAGSGFSVSKTAENLGISAQTVRVHLGNIRRKLSLTSREEVVHFAIQNASELNTE
jgi:DNA-binding NarL/FixJ family response regulator